MDYFDILLAKKLEDDRDPKVEGLSVSENGRYHEDGVVYDPVIVNVPQTPLSKLTVTENGTYTAPSGTAYSEVDVDVPLPENAYLLKEIEDVEIATFTDGSDLPMPKLEVAIEPVQEGSGDPSPENVRPISGWDEVNVTRTGKNLFDKTHYKFVRNGYINGSIVWEGSTTILSYPTDGLSNYWNSPLIDIEPFRGMTLSYSGFVSVSGTVRGIVDKDFNVLATLGTSSTASNTIDLSQYPTVKYLVLTFIASDYNFDNAQLEIGTTATAYEPYNGQTYTIDLNGTRYGGKVDLVSGFMTVDRAGVDLGDLAWERKTDGAISYFRHTFTDSNIGINTYNFICEKYKVVPFADIYSGGQDKVMASYTGQVLLISDTTYSTAEDFKTAMDGVQLVYELATPFTVQLSPTLVKSLQGINNVFADCGNILDLSYLAKEE